MKILVVSMLRLGDLIMVAKAVAALKVKYPNAELHLLTNRSNFPIAKLLSIFDRCHYYDRDLCQKSINDIDHSVFEATDRLEDLALRLNKLEFDTVINLTQNKISAHLCGMINAEDYHGMVTSETGVIHLSSPWFRHLNNYIAGEGSDTFHYIDLFSSALGLDSAAGSSDIFIKPEQEININHKDKIVIQAWSSDKKKDYSAENWRKFFHHYSVIHPGIEFSVLSAPQEKSQLDDFIKAVQQPGISIEPASLSFAELLDYLPQQKAMVSVDTSVKHFAAALGVKTIELALGSSDPRKTGVYAEGSLIIKSRAKCAPCSHLAPCSQGSFVCEQDIEPEMLSMAVNEFTKGNWPSLRVLAEEYRDQAYFGRVGFTETGLWYSQSMHPVEWQKEKETIINLESWKFTLNRKYLDTSPPFNEVAKALSPTLMDPQSLMVERLESVSRQTEMHVDRIARHIHESVKGLASGSSKDTQEIYKELRRLEADMGLGDYLSQYLGSIQVNGISSIRSLREAINELRNYQVSKTNILRNIHKINFEGTV